MSRTTLCLITAAILASLSLSIMLLRRHVLGDAVKLPTDAATWKVTLVVNGVGEGDLRVLTATPLDFGRQHLLRENWKSTELQARPVEGRQPPRRQIVWTPPSGTVAGPFRIHYECYCTTSMAPPTAAMTALAGTLYAPPRPGQYLQAEPGIEADDPDLTAVAQRLTADLPTAQDQLEALFRYVVQEIDHEPLTLGVSETARGCLRSEGGDTRARSRLLVALCRNRGIPARLVNGVTLARGRAQTDHVWVEAWVRQHWLSLCPRHEHFGRVPRTFLVFGFGDLPLVRARNARQLDHYFLVERLAPTSTDPLAEPSLLQRLLTYCSFHALPPAEQHLVEFLLLLPVAALIVCCFRNVIGLGSFGTFAPALLGLCFRELHSLPGLLVFAVILLAGWLMRRVLDRYHLLQVPRMALLLSLVVVVLIAAIVSAAHFGLPATRYLALFPIVILVGMIERFWTLETEDGAASSFRTLLVTMFIAVTISLVLSLHAIVTHLYRYPETLGLVMALQLLIGRYTGYRLTELYRFRDFLLEWEEDPPLLGQDTTADNQVTAARVWATSDTRSPFHRA